MDMFPTAKTDPDEMYTVDWTTSDRSSDEIIDFVYFGLQEQVIGVGFATVCVTGVSTRLVPGLRCEHGVCVA
jgi:hypothetical protein